jgi:hypothetical protein
MRARHRYALLGLCSMLYLSSAVAEASGVSPTDPERQALARLTGKIVGQIVWESNRAGTWQLYTMNADGTGARQLTSGPGDSTAADISADGGRILFTRTAPGEPPAVWIISSDGTGARRLIENASEPEWCRGDRVIHFFRKPDPRKDAQETWEYDLATGQERRLFPPQGVKFEPEVRVAIGTDDASRFVAWSPRPRGTWVLSPDGAVQKHVHGGCEPRVSADQRYGYGVQTAGKFVRFNLSDGGDMLLFNVREGPWSHTYFPYVSRDGNWLVYGACPPAQHDQNTSDYEIFLARLNNWVTPAEPVRLTFNTRTDRWPTVFVAPAGSPNPLAAGQHDLAGNPLTNPPPPPLPIFSFAAQDAAPDWGGDSGLWPQVERCIGTAVFVPGDDAEGGRGGCMRIDYTIEAEPRSFSMWFTPGAGVVDLAGYDRFVVYARGDVPSFTLVVKDRSSDAAGETAQGIADYLVTGVTAQWRRFELPFKSFIPREQAASIDWTAINHAAVAMIAPYNALAGTLQVDNLRAIPRKAD